MLRELQLCFLGVIFEIQSCGVKLRCIPFRCWEAKTNDLLDVYLQKCDFTCFGYMDYSFCIRWPPFRYNSCIFMKKWRINQYIQEWATLLLGLFLGAPVSPLTKSHGAFNLTWCSLILFISLPSAALVLNQIRLNLSNELDFFSSTHLSRKRVIHRFSQA